MEHERTLVNQLFENKLIVKRGFEPIDINKGINWNYRHSENANTYQTYLHSLEIISDILKVYKVDKNLNLLEKAKDIILDWYITDHTKSDNYAWKEHPVSSRINHIISYQTLATPEFKIDSEIFKQLIETHCEFLNNEENYKFNNHGLMMDYSLLNSSQFLDDEEKKENFTNKALYRIRYFIYRDFTRKGVHLENSPEYHKLVLALFRKIERISKQRKLDLGRNEVEIIKLAQNYKNYIILPNQYYPMIGDTGTITEPKLKKNFKNFIDYDAGIAILQNLNTEDQKKSAMLTFKAGYQNKTHKHLDDLSTTFYLDGYEILIDSGKYSYNNHDSIRNHLVSPYAHTTICLEGKSYQLTNPIKDQFKLKITRYTGKKNYKMVTGINELYKNVKLIRHNILTKENIYIIIDRVISKQKEEILQNFNINENAQVRKIDNLTYEIVFGDESFILKTFERYNSNITSEIKKGFVSRRFGYYEENTHVNFKEYSENATYITALFNKKNYDKLKYIALKMNRLSYQIGDERYSIDI